MLVSLANSPDDSIDSGFRTLVDDFVWELRIASKNGGYQVCLTSQGGVAPWIAHVTFLGGPTAIFASVPHAMQRCRALAEVAPAPRGNADPTWAHSIVAPDGCEFRGSWMYAVTGHAAFASIWRNWNGLDLEADGYVLVRDGQLVPNIASPEDIISLPGDAWRAYVYVASEPEMGTLQQRLERLVADVSGCVMALEDVLVEPDVESAAVRHANALSRCAKLQRDLNTGSLALTASVRATVVELRRLRAAINTVRTPK